MPKLIFIFYGILKVVMFFFILSANDCIAFDMSGSLLQVADGTKHLPHLWDLCSNEIVVRSAKHILKVTRIILPASTSLFGLEMMGWNAYIISLNAIKFHYDDFATRCHSYSRYCNMRPRSCCWCYRQQLSTCLHLLET